MKRQHHVHTHTNSSSDVVIVLFHCTGIEGTGIEGTGIEGRRYKHVVMTILWLLTIIMHSNNAISSVKSCTY